jgi:DNA repair protein RadC
MQVRELCVQYRARPDLPPFDYQRVLSNPRELVDFLLPILGQEPVEVFVMVCLTTKFHLLGFHEVARGSIDNVHVAPRDIFKTAILSNAAMFVVGHYVPRHIMRLMCPESLCAGVSARAPTSAARRSKKGT